MLYQTSNPHGGDIYGENKMTDFSANINPYGTPPGVTKAIRNTLSEIYRYPDPYCRDLIRELSLHEEVPGTYILCGNGAAELIYSYCEAICPRTAAEAVPTFLEYSLGLRRTGCKIEQYVLKAEHDFVLDSGFVTFLEEKKPEAVFLCNPNNPTGKLIEPKLLASILDCTKLHHMSFFLDECFLDLTEAGGSLKHVLKDNPQLFIIKAFTKSYGMAGVRLGYGLSSDQNLLRKMSETVQPWNVSLPAQVAGIAALKEQPFLLKARDTISSERKWLEKQLKKLGMKVYPSDANFLLFYGPAQLCTKLKKYGIVVRNCDNYPGLGHGWYRVAVLLREKNEKLIEAMSLVTGKEP